MARARMTPDRSQPRALTGVWLPAALVVIWETAVRMMPQSDSLAPPSLVLLAGTRALLDGSLAAATLQTLMTALTGAALGGGLGLLSGLLLGLSPLAARMSRAPVEALRPLPSVALIPLAMMAFGFGHTMGIAIVAFATFWPMLILAQGAVAGIDRQLHDVARALRLTLPQKLVKIILPAALPRLVIALRLAVGVALVVAVTVEIAANPQGLGYGLIVSQQSLQPALMLAHLVWIGLVGWLLNAALMVLERRVARRGMPPSSGLTS
jgi:ABC-type nitrate/sulfonate/bicarbonate transport system permease component